jgi:hypothetical protein
MREGLTWNHIACIHGILVLDEAEAIHELDLHDLACAVGVEVVLNIGLGSCIHTVQSAMPEVQASLRQLASSGSSRSIIKEHG